MRILGIDLGSKRIGIAISDALGITAQGLLTLERKEDSEVIEFLNKTVQEKDVTEIVVGLPLNMDGSEGEQAKAATHFADILKEKLKLPVKLWDERLSTVEVERVMIEAGTSRAKRKKKIDKVAAQVILQGYLNSRKQNV